MIFQQSLKKLLNRQFLQDFWQKLQLMIQLAQMILRVQLQIAQILQIQHQTTQVQTQLQMQHKIPQVQTQHQIPPATQQRKILLEIDDHGKELADVSEENVHEEE